jgi:hypothetical protein
MDMKEIEMEGVDCIHQAHGRNEFQAVVNRK